ncbi:hypothetical protein D8674_023028 [Pyrus ussuriensis x Pyrus communis]|uniref:Uncharacterized protein n=1 Tax=Pyrus ussuriensis x Pyrus communis TaxID=2448454 RepID=A0A5N5GTC4_9ROSA|nr:hypothetical protein D8674_023028 [Pyrus ussuriensis x Pyrus communis]
MKCVVNNSYDKFLKPFLLALIAKAIHLLKVLIIGPDNHDRDRKRVLEAAVHHVADMRTNYKYYNNLDWPEIIIMFCLTSAIGLALLSVQIPSGQLPVIFYFLGLSILLAFTCILVSKFVHSNYCPAGISIPRLFHNFGLFFGVIAFFISITIPFPLWFKCAAYSICVTAFLLIVLCNLHFNKYYKPHDTPNNSASKNAIDPAVESCQSGTSTIDDQACMNNMV